MSNIYQKGRRKEYAICKKLREEGFDIVQRSAGSHSKVDIFAIDTKGRRIKLVQCKRVLSQSMNTTNEQLKIKIESEISYLNGLYSCMFVVI
jgi:Holliday junction resolvase